MAKKRLALLTTGWWKYSHADVIAAKILRGYNEDDGPGPDLEIVSVWIDSERPTARHRGENVCKQAGIPIFAIATDALHEDIDGILLLCNQGEAPRPAAAWDAIFEFVENQGHAPVPVYSSKTISGPTFADSKATYDHCRRLGIPLMAFSGYVVAYRNNNMPMGTTIQRAAAAAASNAGNQQSFAHFGVHTLQALQCQMERRDHGETGVKAVRCLSGPGMWKEFEDRDWLLEKVITGLAPGGNYKKATEANLAAALLLIDYIDNTTAAVAHLDGHYIPSGETGETDVAFMAEQGLTYFPVLFRSLMIAHGGTWMAVTDAIDRFMQVGRSPVPIERTLLTDGIMDAAIRSRLSGGQRISTPELAIAYAPIDHKHLVSPEP